MAPGDAAHASMAATGIATRTSSTRSDTPKWRPTASRIFGANWRRQARDRLALYHLGICRGVPLGDQLLDHLEGALELLVGHVLERIALLDLHLARPQKRTDFHISRRLLLTHLFNRGRPVLFEVGSEREQEILVERSTRSLQGPARVSRMRRAVTHNNPYRCC